MPFCTTLEAAHVDRETWTLTRPLIWKGQWQYVVIRTGFQTDFASIPKPLRWLLDNAGRNAEAGVLHDAAWRESMRPNPRIDPWFADGMLRRALRETGSTALTRGIIWFGVRIAATVSGRFGKLGPSFGMKLFQLVVVLVIGVVTALPPTIVVLVGIVWFWLWNWLVAILWYLGFERRRFSTPPNWPWPLGKRSGPPKTDPPPRDLLVIIPFAKDPTTKGASEPTDAQRRAAEELAALVEAKGDVTEEQIDRWLA